MDLIKFLRLPVNASAHGHEIDMMIYMIHILMLVLFIGWGLFYIVVLVRFNRHTHPKADYHGLRSHATSAVEIALAVIEVVLLVGFSIPFWAKQVNAFPSNRPDTIEIRVVAEQFAWNIHYPGGDGIFGKTDMQYFDKQSNPLGIDPSDQKGKDDIVTINQLHLPIGRPVVIYLSSKDVIHCIGLNVMRVKQDVIPGLSIPVWFTPTKTGQFEIACAQLCGIGHYSMKGYLTIHTQEDYDQWLSEQATSQGSGEGGSDSFWN